MISLKPLSRDDATDKYLGWVNDPEVTKYLNVGRFPVTKEKLIAYIDRMNESKEHVIFAIYCQDKHIGNITLNDIDWINRTANVGIMIGEKGLWGGGYGTEAVKLIVDYAFNRLNLQKVWAGVHRVNTASWKMFGKAGFDTEAILKRELYLDGQYYDKYIMSILREPAWKGE